MRRFGLASVLLALFGLFSAAGAAPSSAAPQTLVLQINATMPGTAYAVLGTLTADGDSAAGVGTWSFQGTVNTQLSRAAGTGTLANTPSGATLSITEVTTWQVPYAARPAQGAAISINPGPGNTILLSYGPLQGVPLALNPPATFPLPAGSYTASTPGSGSQSLPNLPNTGVAPALATPPHPGRGAAALAALTLLTVVAALVARRPRAVGTPG